MMLVQIEVLFVVFMRILSYSCGAGFRLEGGAGYFLLQLGRHQESIIVLFKYYDYSSRGNIISDAYA